MPIEKDITPTNKESKEQTFTYISHPIKDYWGLRFEGDELANVIAFKDRIEQETTERLEEIVKNLEIFWGVPTPFSSDSLPVLDISENISGSSGSWKPSNRITLSLKLSLPYFIGEVEHLEETPHWPTLGHELGHFVHIATLAGGDGDEYFETYMKTNPVVQEFVARISHRFVAENMSIFFPAC